MRCAPPESGVGIVTPCPVQPPDASVVIDPNDGPVAESMWRSTASIAPKPPPLTPGAVPPGAPVVAVMLLVPVTGSEVFDRPACPKESTGVMVVLILSPAWNVPGWRVLLSVPAGEPFTVQA